MQLLPTANRVVPDVVEAMSMTELTDQPKIRYSATVAREVTWNTSSEPEKDPENSKDTFLGTVGSDSSRDDTWTVTLTLQGKPVTLQLNTWCVIPEKIWTEVGQPQLTASDRTLRGPDSRAISTLGMFLGTFTHNNRSMETEVYVVKRLAKPLLGRPIILTLGLVKLVAAVEQQHIALISLPGPREAQGGVQHRTPRQHPAVC